MALVRAQAVFDGATGLPEDRYVATFNFSNDAAYSTHAAAVGVSLAAFFDLPGTLPAGFDALGSLMPGYVKRPWRTYCYDMSTSQPRVPTTFVQTLPAVKTGGVDTVPSETAVCLSLRGAPPVTPRRRGRLFFGPLNSVCLQAGSTTVPARPTTNVTGSLIGAASRLLADGVGWCIYSPTNNAYVPVVGGWVDNEFDTQRRRGNKATTRTQWGA